MAQPDFDFGGVMGMDAAALALVTVTRKPGRRSWEIWVLKVSAAKAIPK